MCAQHEMNSGHSTSTSTSTRGLPLMGLGRHGMARWPSLVFTTKISKNITRTETFHNCQLFPTPNLKEILSSMSKNERSRIQKTSSGHCWKIFTNGELNLIYTFYEGYCHHHQLPKPTPKSWDRALVCKLAKDQVTR